MVQFIQLPKKGPSKSEQLAQGISRAAVGTAQHLYQQEQKKQQQENVSKFLENEYDIKNTKDLPAEFQMEIMKTGQAKKNKLAGELTEDQKKTNQDIFQRAMVGDATPEEEASLPIADQLNIKKTKQKDEYLKLKKEKADQPAKTQASKPIDPDQLDKIESVRSQPGYDDMDEVDQYRALTRAGVSKENAEAEARLTGQKLERSEKRLDTSYKAHEDFINQTTDKYRSYETDTKPRLMQLQKIASDEQLVGPTAAAFLDTMGIPLGALEDPSSELYQKVSLDLLKGLPETYGNRIMKVEVDNFLKTIPSLLNSASGRRMIASNMLKLGEMKEVYYDEMRRQQKDAIDSSKPLPKDFQQRVLDQVKPQIDRINNEFVQLSEIKSVPQGTVPFFYNGKVKFVPQEHAEWASENGGRRVW